MDTQTALILIGGSLSALVSFIAFVGRLVATGKWFPAPIVVEKNKEIAYLRERLANVELQLKTVNEEYAATVTQFMKDVRDAARKAKS